MMVGAPAALLDMGHILEVADWTAKESLLIPALVTALSSPLPDCFNMGNKATIWGPLILVAKQYLPDVRTVFSSLPTS